MIRSKIVAGLFLFTALAGMHAAAAGSPVALVKAGSVLLEWVPLVEAESATLTLSDPRGDIRTFRFGPGATPALSLFDAKGAPLPDGSYTWELRTAEGAQSGSFTIAEGSLVSPDLAEQPRLRTAADQVVPDDLIVDGKGCIGLGCANNETFGSETLRLKQGVVRLHFQDTSSGAFPGSDWQITTNDSASGGANRFSIEDLTAATTPLSILGGAPNNSIYVATTGRVGLGTATPAERLHVLENANANTIITAENPNTGLSALGALRARSDTATVNFQAHGSGRTIARFGQTLASWAEFLQVSGNGLIIGTVVDKPLILGTNSANRVHIAADGNIGLGMTSPTSPLHHSSGATLTAGGVWTNASSRESKQEIAGLPADEALATLRSLEPVKFAYKVDPAERHVGFIAEDVPDLVASPDRKSLSPMDVVAVLTKVAQEQQKKIDELSTALGELQAKLAEIEGERP
ncbi:MAG TPA: tail fiber domain-containing protein [Thermoanaerobaculia bacterium]|nr:tail fiber domain-containing protein [Thermoanaerobaculia bacterium]